MSIEPPLMRDVLNGVLNSRVDGSGLFSAFPATQLTPAEQAAGVTPVNYAYAPGNVKRYGAKGDGVNDDHDAIQAAFDVAKIRGLVVLFPQPDETYLVQGELDLTPALGSVVSGFVIRGEGNTNTSVTGFPSTITFKFSGPTSTTGHGFDCTGTLGVIFENLSITTDTSVYPKTCFLLARDSSGRSQICRFRNVHVRGSFSKTLLYNYGSEDDQYEGCTFWNLAADADSSTMDFTSRNIRGLTSSFTTIATGQQSCIDHKIFGGEIAHEGGQTTTDCIRLDNINSLKIFGPWMMSKNGRSLIYVDTTNGQSPSVTLIGITGENQGANSQKYGIYLGDTVSTVAQWLIQSCIFPNITNSIFAHANVTLSGFKVDLLDNAGQGAGVNIAGTLQGDSRFTLITSGIAVGTLGENNVDLLNKVISRNAEASLTLRNTSAPSGRQNFKVRSNGVGAQLSFCDNSNAVVANAMQLLFDGTNVTQTDILGSIVTLSKRACLPNDAGSAQTTYGVYQGSGVPSNANGSNGDFYFRGDTPGTANQRVYIKNAGAWAGIL